MKKIALLIIPVIFLLSTCALEIANVIGPGGGWVYYDKGNYNDGWRYKECSPYDLGELKITELKDTTNYSGLLRAVELCIDQTDNWYVFDWEIPDEADMKKMLECFSYGLTRFKPDYYYLSVNGQPRSTKSQPKYDIDPNDGDTNQKITALDLSNWEVVIFHKNFDSELNGKVETVTLDEFPESEVIRIRPIRRF